jgi:hypothetical protein
MSHFVLQTIKGTVEHDFVFHLKKSLDYLNWVYPQGVHTYEFSDIPIRKKDSYPVGDVPFVLDHLKLNNELNLDKCKPINIPYILRNLKFTQRNIIVSSSPLNPFETNSFVKSNTQYKAFNELIKTGENVQHKDNQYFFSEEIEIDSEWRVFVLNQQIVGLQHYIGDFLEFPDINFIKDIISNYEDSPGAYTVDIGINKNSNFLVEIHPFVSCGLYGFADYKILPKMFIEGIKYMKQ